MKKITLLIISVTIISCAQDKVIDVNSLSKQYDIPSAVMGKINKDGTAEFYSFGPSRWDRNDPINEKSLKKQPKMTENR
jgi:hypothetical protein|tara:strand:- start:2094 stop:2330 length:237 start_codon:yes stop_codon:yes gene_type:complete